VNHNNDDDNSSSTTTSTTNVTHQNNNSSSNNNNNDDDNGDDDDLAACKTFASNRLISSSDGDWGVVNLLSTLPTVPAVGHSSDEVQAPSGPASDPPPYDAPSAAPAPDVEVRSPLASRLSPLASPHAYSAHR
jgi:hypothetical protein